MSTLYTVGHSTHPIERFVALLRDAGDPVEVAARPVPVFKPSKELRALVADETSEAEPAQGM